jgi:hypothetical protein
MPICVFCFLKNAVVHTYSSNFEMRDKRLCDCSGVLLFLFG